MIKMNTTFLVFLLSTSFCLLFSVFSISSYISTAALNQLGLVGVGYLSACLIYTSFSISTLFSGHIVRKIGCRPSILIGSVPYVCYIAFLIKPHQIPIYISSLFLGIGASLLWTGQGTYLTYLSNSKTISKHTNIFFSIYCFSNIIGNLMLYFVVGDIAQFDNKFFFNFFLLLTFIGAIGSLSFFLPFYSCFKSITTSYEEKSNTTDLLDFFRRLKETLYSQLTLCLLYTSFHTGMTSSFYNGIYGTMVAQSKFLLDGNKRFISFCGIATGLGSISGGFVQLYFSSNNYKKSNGTVSVLFAGLLQITSLILISLIFPDESSIINVSDPKTSLITHYKIVALIIAFSLGLSDFIYNTQLYQIFSTSFIGRTEDIFALYKCVQSIAMAISFGYSGKLYVKWHLLIQVFILNKSLIYEREFQQL